MTFTNKEVAQDYLFRLFNERPELADPLNNWYHAGKVMEEAGEAWREYVRLTGLHRHPGDRAKYAEELADTVISAYAAAIDQGIDLDVAIARKHNILMSREMREGNSS